MSKVTYCAHEVVREDRSDGAMILTSGHALGDVAERTTDWLEHWAQATPDAVFLAERSGAGWREVTYAAARAQARAIAASLQGRDLGPDRPIMIISGNSVDHGLLTLGAQYVGVPTVPVAEQYALIPAARGQLDFVAGLVKPGMIYAEDGDALAEVLARDAFAGAEIVVSRGGPDGVTTVDELSRGSGELTVEVGPGTVAKILMTSGSTSSPKGVLTTHKMMCTNQAQIAIALPFLKARAPRIVDWLPWNHVFGGSHNFNMMLANGGAFYVDGGKPVPALVGKTIENLRMKTGTMAFNVPIGFAKLRDVMREDKALRQSYFEELDMLFYAGASLPQDVWADLEDMAREVRGEMPLFTSSWGLTETAPACLLQHEPTQMSGIVGVPMPGVSVKLIPDDDMRCEVRVKGPSIFTSYLDQPEMTADAFDDEGYFLTGDAMKFVDPDDMNKGLKFDGRISEDFKLMSGTWVRAANLRLDLLVALGPLAQDIVLTGADRDQIGLMIIPSAELRGRDDVVDEGGLLVVPSATAALRDVLAATSSGGSATRITRAVILGEPPSMADGEITAKGNLNFRKLQVRRAELLARLYDDGDAAVIRP